MPDLKNKGRVRSGGRDCAVPFAATVITMWGPKSKTGQRLLKKKKPVHEERPRGGHGWAYGSNYTKERTSPAHEVRGNYRCQMGVWGRVLSPYRKEHELGGGWEKKSRCSGQIQTNVGGSGKSEDVHNTL